ncbi:hypothetical protein PGR6_38870 [Pseudomonas sp. GR 6-02]|nr:hypothetical protein PGR6_38870 [Pseudomonas sp. GR 6-02]
MHKEGVHSYSWAVGGKIAPLRDAQACVEAKPVTKTGA